MEVNKKAINIFDFDGTLTTDSWPKCFVWVKKFGYRGDKRNEILQRELDKAFIKYKGEDIEKFYAFFNQLLQNKVITMHELMDGEKFIHYNNGVIEFLKNSATNNYIISGGIKEFLDNLKIAKYIEGIYGTTLIFNDDKEIIGINDVITDDKKIKAIKEILKINNREGDNCENVYYIGDGYSDAPAMRFVHEHGGKSIFVYLHNKDDFYKEHNEQIYNMLKNEGIVDYTFNADYQVDSQLYKVLERK